MNKIEPIKKRYYEIAKKLGAPEKYVHFNESNYRDASPYIEFRTLYYYVCSERGNESDRRPTNDPDEILYWLISDLTKQMASDFEQVNRNEAEDSRRMRFAKHVELLNSVDSKWAKRQKDEYDWELKYRPFNNES